MLGAFLPLQKKVGFHHRGNRRKGGERFEPRRDVSHPIGLRVLISFACALGESALPETHQARFASLGGLCALAV